jgi:O-phospho-L-seryl-tRNASec:L-selenocysteinyl-tRNA synthase
VPLNRPCCCSDTYPHAYLTAAAAIGTTPGEVEELEQRLDKCFAEFRKKQGRAG